MVAGKQPICSLVPYSGLATTLPIFKLIKNIISQQTNNNKIINLHNHFKSMYLPIQRITVYLCI